MNSIRNVAAAFVCLLCVLLITVPAYGYIFPNAAGLLSPILILLLVAAAAAFTLFRKQVGPHSRVCRSVCAAEPMSREPDFLSTIKALWFRLITLAIVSLVFAEALYLAQGEVHRWAFYLTAPEVAFEMVVRLVVAALAGLGLGTLCTALIAPFLRYLNSSRERVAGWATNVSVVLVLFLVSRYALEVLIGLWSGRGPRFYFTLRAAHFLAFVIALCIPRARKEMVTSLDGVLRETITRRTAIATVVGSAALVGTEFALGKASPIVKAALSPQRPKSSILLITFDALNAEDMSVYGYRLATTPNIDAFARKGTVFTNFYSASTFTTPSVATMLTGRYPSESRVYHLQGRLRAENAESNLPHLMRAAGYATGAFISNPSAYYLAKDLEKEFDVLPEPVFQQGGLKHLWDATRPLHQDSGVGSRVDEYWDLEYVWNTLGRGPIRQSVRFRPVASFEQARQILGQLPSRFFLWLHVVTPHDPYLPDLADRGRFLSASALPGLGNELDGLWKPHYEADQQSQVNEYRLRYDEFIATADRAFGAFMSELENSGTLRDITVIVSADHGESFEGGVYQHKSAYQTRPVIHVPLIIRTPGQQEGRTITFTADQTALSPTILELAGQPKPDSMRGESLVPWLTREGHREDEGLAFTQYFERNNVSKPLRHGTVGVIDGRYQYVFDLDTQKGVLRPLNEAQIWNLDRSDEYPGRAAALRAAILSRFPELVQKAT